MEIKEIEKAVKDMSTATTEGFGKIDGKMQEQSARLVEIEQMMTRRRSGGGSDVPASWGAAMVNSEEFKNLAKVKRGTARIETKTTLTSLGASAGALGLVDQRLDPIMIPRRRLAIRDLISAGETSANSVRFVRQTGRTLTVQAVSESTTKPESELSFESDTANVIVIATTLPASKQILDDAPALASTIDAELFYGLDLEIENQILLGDGSDENLVGLISQATAYSAPFQPEQMQRLDAILLGQAQLEALNFTATGVAVNSQDWARIRSTKDSEGRYIAGGPLTGAPRQLWDLPIVSSNSIPAGKFLIGDFRRAAIVYSRQTNTIEVSTEHSDFFVKNLIMIRAECRIAMAVTQPEALVYGSFQSTT